MNIWGSKLMRMEHMIQEFRTISLGRSAIYTNGILWDRRVARKTNEVSTQDRNKMLYYVVKKYGRFKDMNTIIYSGNAFLETIRGRKAKSQTM
jgi:hypothetical protein